MVKHARVTFKLTVISFGHSQQAVTTRRLERFLGTGFQVTVWPAAGCREIEGVGYSGFSGSWLSWVWLRVEFEEIGGTYLLCDEIYGSD